MRTVRTVKDLRRLRQHYTEGRETVALVPTMGALHEGHLSLVRQAKYRCQRVIVSLFVNPKQFSAGEDLDSYPRTYERDAQLLSELDVDVLYMPTRDEMYQAGASTTVNVVGVGEGLCQATRPDFFSGVATVVAKLLLQCLPDVAIFGEKDYQQLLVIKRMAQDLDIPVTIESGSTVRENDGLALSSRNAYLSEDERISAPHLYYALTQAQRRIHAGESISKVLWDSEQYLISVGFEAIDYFVYCDADTLAPCDRRLTNRPARFLAAAWLGKARLIDNIAA